MKTFLCSALLLCGCIQAEELDLEAWNKEHKELLVQLEQLQKRADGMYDAIDSIRRQLERMEISRAHWERAQLAENKLHGFPPERDGEALPPPKGKPVEPERTDTPAVRAPERPAARPSDEDPAVARPGQ